MQNACIYIPEMKENLPKKKKSYEQNMSKLKRRGKEDRKMSVKSLKSWLKTWKKALVQK